MAVALMRLGRHDEAAELLESTIRIDRRYDLLYSHLAEARLALGDTVSAVRALEEFAEITLNQQDRRRAMQLLEVLRARVAPPPVIPVPGPSDTTGVSQPPVRQDTFVPPPRPAPRTASGWLAALTWSTRWPSAAPGGWNWPRTAWRTRSTRWRRSPRACGPTRSWR